MMCYVCSVLFDLQHSLQCVGGCVHVDSTTNRWKKEETVAMRSRHCWTAWAQRFYHHKSCKRCCSSSRAPFKARESVQPYNQLVH